jgi:opacity protein-like surface antigen
MKKLSALAVFAVLLAASVLAQVVGQPVSIVAAENFYGDIAKQIGGPASVRGESFGRPGCLGREHRHLQRH